MQKSDPYKNFYKKVSGTSIDEDQKTAVLIWSKKGLQRFLKKKRSSRYPTILLNLRDRECNFEVRYDVLVHESRDYGDGNSTSFLKDYRDVIGQVSAKLVNPLWWATNCSAKNRFASKIPELLKQIEACAAILKKDNTRVIIYSPDVSVVRSLADLCAEENFVLSYNRSYVGVTLMWDRLLAGVQHLKFGSRLFYRLAVFRFFARGKIYRGRHDISIALKTFLYESSIAEDKNFKFTDPMFGRLAEYIHSREKLIVLVHVLGPYYRTLNKLRKQDNLIIVPVENWLSLGQLIDILASALSSRLDLELPDDLEFRGIPVSKVIQTELYRKYNDLWVDQLAYKSIMASFARDVGPNTYIQTFENYPWEKLAIKGLKSVAPHMKIIGFQQAVVPEAAVNFFSSESEFEHMPRPDKLLCVGEEPLKIINELGGKTFPNAEVGCGLRYEYLSGLRSQPRREIRQILVVPEGVLNVLPMIEWVARQLVDLNRYKVTFRFHPALPYSKIKQYLSVDLSEVRNCSVSTNDLQGDLLAADLCIYWGSTVAVEALAMSRPLIFFDPEQPLSNDPLFQCNYLKWVARKTDSLETLIEQIDSLEDEEFQRQSMMAKMYVKRYFEPVTDRGLAKFLE